MKTTKPGQQIKNRLRAAARSATRGSDPSKDIGFERQRQALKQTVAFVENELTEVQAFRHETANSARILLLEKALSIAPPDGLVLEFGVASGYTLRVIEAARPHCHGFDSFEGLPENWRAGYHRGAFAQDLPQFDSAQLHVGWFEDTLPNFLKEYQDQIAFVHMDADLYSSTKYIFDTAFDRFQAGTVILFDEYFNYPGWQDHEHKAFREFLSEFRGSFEYLGYNEMHEQVAVRLL